MNTREFHLIDALNIWDSVFLDYFLENEQNPFLLLDCICIAMIVFVRDDCIYSFLIIIYLVLAKNDNSMLLQRLLKYPPVESVLPIVEKAWSYKNIVKDVEQKRETVQKIAPKLTEQKKDIILFNSGLKPFPQNTEKEREKSPFIEEKSENMPSIMDPNKKKFEEKNLHNEFDFISKGKNKNLNENKIKKAIPKSNTSTSQELNELSKKINYIVGLLNEEMMENKDCSIRVSTGFAELKECEVYLKKIIENIDKESDSNEKEIEKNVEKNTYKHGGFVIQKNISNEEKINISKMFDPLGKKKNLF